MIRIEKILEITEQEHKAQQVQQVPRVYKGRQEKTESMELMELMGLPGPAGPFYKKGGNVSQFNEGETGLSIVQCDIGDIAISGSADYIVSQGGSIFEINDFQSDFSNSTWFAAKRIQILRLTLLDSFKHSLFVLIILHYDKKNTKLQPTPHQILFSSIFLITN